MATQVAAELYRCDICGTVFTCKAEAELCEVRGIDLPRFVAGDVIHLVSSEMKANGLNRPDALIDSRQFNIASGPMHSFALAGRGLHYHVRVRGGQKIIVPAISIQIENSDYIYCVSWSDFMRRANTGHSQDTEGLDQLRQMLNRRLNLGL